MKLKIDETLCSGHGRCARYAPAVFTLDDAGFNTAAGEVIEIPDAEVGNAVKAMRACPERAITRVDS